MIFNFVPRQGDMFVDLNEPYEKIKFIKAEISEKNEGELDGVFIADHKSGPQIYFDRKPLNEFVGPFFPMFSSIRAPRPELSELYSLFKKVAKLIDNFLAKQHDFSANPIGLIKEISGIGYTRQQVESVLKSLLGNSLEYCYSTKGYEGRISFGERRAKTHRWSIYFRSIATELSIKSKQIGLLVSHGPTVGNFREILLRDLIKKFLPQKFRIATGFIQGFPNQIDILIFDAHNYAPLFQDGDLVVVKQECVRAIIEVKTNLSSKTLNESLELFYKISLPGFKSTKLPIFKGVYSFESTIKRTSSVAKSIFSYYNDSYFDTQLQRETTRGIWYLFHQVSCVTTMNQHCVFTKYQPANFDGTGKMIPYLYSLQDENGLDIQTAMFLSLLFEYLDVEPYAKTNTAWNLMERLNDFGVLKIEKKLTSDDWSPSFASDSEHSQEQNSIKRRIGTFEKWFSGRMSTDALIRDQITPETTN